MWLTHNHSLGFDVTILHNPSLLVASAYSTDGIRQPDGGDIGEGPTETPPQEHEFSFLDNDWWYGIVF